MIRAVLAACLLGLLAADGAAGLESASSTRLATTTTSFEDARGEDPQGPDITTVVVSTDDDRLLSFRVDIPSNPTLSEDMRIRIWLDSDDDRTTGLAIDGLVGFDYFLLVDRWELGLGAVGLFGCSGSTCTGGQGWGPQTSLRFSYESGARFTIDTAELGIDHLRRFRFSVETMSGVVFDPVGRRYDFTNVHRDFAPQLGEFWTHESRPLLVQSFSATPAIPRAGKPFALRLTAIRTDTGTALASGNVSCSFRTAGKSVRPRSNRFVGKQAVCVFGIPPAAKGQRFRSSISVLLGGTKVTRSLSGTIR